MAYNTATVQSQSDDSVFLLQEEKGSIQVKSDFLWTSLKSQAVRTGSRTYTSKPQIGESYFVSLFASFQLLAVRYERNREKM